MGNPFDRLNSDQYAGKAAVGSPLQISTAQNTSSTARIGTLSIDLSGGQSAQESNTGNGVLDAIGGVLTAPLGLAGNALGGLGELLQAPQDLALKIAGTPQRRIERYKETGDARSAAEAFRGELITDEKKYAEAYRSGVGIVASASGIKGAASTPENILMAATGANLLAGSAAITGLGKLATAGRVLNAANKIGLATQVPKMLSDDPKYLSDGAKQLIRNGSSPDEVWDYIHKNGEQFSGNLLEDITAALVYDPLNYFNAPGELVKFAGKISAVQDIGKTIGKSFDEMIATSVINGKPLMSKTEVAVAKRLQLLGPAYKFGVNVGSSSLEKFRGPAVAATANVLGIDKIAAKSDFLDSVSPDIGESFRRAVNHGLLYVQHAASKAPLAQNSAENARVWAESLIEVAAVEGIAGLKKHPGLRGLPDSFYEKFVGITEAFKSNRQEETTKALQDAMDMLVESKNLDLLNSELSGPWLNNTGKLAWLGRFRRGSTIAAARMDVIRSYASHEVPIQKALAESPDLASSAYVSEMISRFVAAVGDKGNAVHQSLSNEFNQLGKAHAAASNLDAKVAITRDIAKRLEVLRMTAYGKAIEIMRPVKRLGGEAAKVTIVTTESLTKQRLTDFISELDMMIKANDGPGIEKFLLETVPSIKDMAFAYDSLVYSKTVLDNPLEEGRIVLKRMKDMLAQDAVVSRLPDSVNAQLDALEWGLNKPPLTEEQKLAQMAEETIAQTTEEQTKVVGANNSLFKEYIYLSNSAVDKKLFRGHIEFDQDLAIADIANNLNDQHIVTNIPLDSPIWHMLDIGSVHNEFEHWETYANTFAQKINEFQDDAFTIKRLEEAESTAPSIMRQAFESGFQSVTPSIASMQNAGLAGDGIYQLDKIGETVEEFYRYGTVEGGMVYLDGKVISQTDGAGQISFLDGKNQKVFVDLWPKDYNETWLKSNAIFVGDSLNSPVNALKKEIAELVDGVFKVSDNHFVASRMVNGMRRSAVYEFLLNKVHRALVDYGHTSLWYEPTMKATRANADMGAKVAFVASQDNFFKQHATMEGASLLTQRVNVFDLINNKSHPAGLAVGDMINDGHAITLPDVDMWTNVTPLGKLNFLFDKTRMAKMMAFGIHPENEFLDMNKVILHTAPSQANPGQYDILQATKLVGGDQRIDNISQNIWMPSSADFKEVVLDWIQNYLTSSAKIATKSSGGTQTLNEVQLYDLLPDLYVVSSTGEADTKKMAEAIINHLENDNPAWIDELRATFASLDKLRRGKFDFPSEYIKKWNRVTGMSTSISWADVFHNIDSGRVQGGQGTHMNNTFELTDEMSRPDTLAKYLDNAIAGSLGGGGKVTPFDLIAHSKDPMAVRVRSLIDEGILPENEAAVFDFLTKQNQNIPQMTATEYAEYAALTSEAHGMAEFMGSAADVRIVAYLNPMDDPINEAAGTVPKKLYRLFTPWGKTLEGIRPVAVQHLNFPTTLNQIVPAPFDLTSYAKNTQAKYLMKGMSGSDGGVRSAFKADEVSILRNNLNTVIAMSGKDSAKITSIVAKQAEEKAKQAAFDEVSSNEALAAMLDARTKAKQLGYELGYEPPRGYLMSWGITRDVRGTPVLRPKYDLYTSIGEEYNAADYGVKQLDKLSFDTSLKTRLQQFASTPISNNELYDTAVERMRIFLGGRISREEALRAFAEITQQAINQEINPGGLNDHEVARIFTDAFGGGDKAARKYERVFGGHTTPRAALLFALENDLSKIGYSSGISKRIQSRFPSLATMAQKLFPLARYRYNPIFNQQEGIEPFALTVLRGIGGKSQYEEASLLNTALAAPGTFRYDAHEVGAHILRYKATIADAIQKQNPGINEVVLERTTRQYALSNVSSLIGWLMPVGEKAREAISVSKGNAVSVTAADEMLKNVAEQIAAAFPEFRTLGYDLTGSIEPKDWLRYFIDSHVAGTIPEEIMRLGETAARSYTFGAPMRIDATKVIDELLTRVDLSQENLDEIQNIVLIAQKSGASDPAQKELISAFENYRKEVRYVPASQQTTIIAKGGVFQGQQALTTGDGITAEISRSINEWAASAYSGISPYLAAKAEFGIQETALVRDEAAMMKAARSISKYNPAAIGDARYKEIDELINNLDKAIAGNRIVSRSPIYRKLKLSDLVNNPDSVKVGDVIGMENIAAFSRNKDFVAGWGGDTMLILQNAKGIPGIDIAAIGKGVSHESEVLLPRGLKMRVLDVYDSANTKYLVVDVEMPRQFQLAFDRLAPSDSAMQRLIKANNTIKVEDEQVRRSYETLVKLFEQQPAIFDDARRAGIDLGVSPQAQRSIRQKRVKTAKMPEVIANSQDPYSVQFSRSVSPVSDLPGQHLLREEEVFGTFIQKAGTGMNQGGETGIWIGKDGVKRYVKKSGTHAQFQAAASLNEFLAARLYRKMGVNVPLVSLVKRNDELYVASEWQEGIKEFGKIGLDNIDPDIARQFVDNHVADVIMGNWDAVGPDGMNVGLLPDGSVVRIDVGSSGIYRAGGEFKTLKDARTVDFGFWYDPKGKVAQGRPAYGYRKVLDAAYPNVKETATTTDIPTFVAQFDDMIKSLGDPKLVIKELIDSVQGELDPVIPQKDLNKLGRELADLIEGRIRQIEPIADEIRKERVLAAESALAAQSGRKATKKLPKLQIMKLDPWHMHFAERLAAQMNNGFRLPGLEEAMLAVERGEIVDPQQAKMLGRGFADYIYKRASTTQFVDWARAGMARSVEVASKEQLYNPFKSALERTLNHPYLGFYPTSYMFGKILPVFGNALFKYAPFTGEYAPLYGFRKLNVIADHTAAALETNNELQQLVMNRTPLINYLNALLPGIPTDVGASMPLWVRDGILKPVVQGKFEDIPGSILDAAKKSSLNAVGPLRTMETFQGSVQQIQTFLTGDPQRSILDEISDFLVPGAGN